MKKNMKKILICLLAFVMATVSPVTGLGTVSSAAALKQLGYYDYPEEPDVEPDTRTQYYSISNAYIASYTSTSITFSWYSSGNNDGFYVYRKSPYDTDYQKIGTVTNVMNSTHSFKDTGFRRGISFSYRIVAYFDTNGTITEAGGVSTDFKASISKPKITSISRKGTKATVKWKKASGVSGYQIYRKVGSGSYKKVKTVKSGSTLKWTASKISKTKTTRFKVRAYVKYGSHYVYGSFGDSTAVYSMSTQKVANKFKKLQKQYPTGKYWNHVGKRKYNSSTITSRPCDHSRGNGLTTCNHYNCPNGVLGYQCYGFAWKMSDLIYGKTAKIKNFRSFSKCRMGDVIRYSGHSVIITEKHSNYVVVGECNAGNTCIIHWGRKVYKSELKGAVYSRRYR